MNRTAPLHLAAALLLLAVPAAADDAETTRVEIQVEDDSGERLDLSIASSWLGPLVASLDLECEPTDDPDALRMAKNLDRGGRGSRYRFVDDDGDAVLAVREGDRLTLRTRGRDGESSTVEMPWSFAECFLLGREPKEGLLAGDGLRLRVDDRDGESRVRIRID
jgi:hypothetical protein